MADRARRIYLDYNATAPILPEVAGAIANVLSNTGNPSSVHESGRRTRAAIEDARDSLAQLVHCSPEAVTFTSGGTEANATVISGLIKSRAVRDVYSSSVEHVSVLDHIEPSNRIAVDANGLIDLDELDDALSTANKPSLVCVMLANNETGVIQPIGDVCRIVHDHHGVVLCDAVQALGKVNLDLLALGADFYTVSAHKMGGPPGVGAIIKCSELDFAPLVIGGGQEKKKRSGTENTPGIVGFGVAAGIRSSSMQANGTESLKTRFEKALLNARSDAVIHGSSVQRLPNTTNISLPGVSSERQVMTLDLSGFSVSAGSACSSGKMSKSHVLEAMGLSEEDSNSAIRISIGPDVQWEDLENFVDVWSAL